MNLQLKAKENIYEKASLSLEGAIIIPFFCIFCIILLYMLQVFGAYTKMNRAVCKTAETMSAYASLYHTHGLEQVENTLLSKLKRSSNDKTISENEKMIKQFINLKNLAKQGDDIIYEELAKGLYKYYYEREEYFTSDIFESEKVSFKGSKFFNDGNTIILKVQAEVKEIVPLPFNISERIKISVTQRVKCWLYGKINSEAIVDLSVWDMDNLSRGRYFRSLYGANLGEFYPVLSIYDGNTGTMIKSLDHTSKTYQSSETLKKTIMEYVNKLAEFEGTDNKKYQDYTPVIKEGEIKEKVLLMIFPTNEMTENQLKTVTECVSLAGGKGVVVKIEMYGKSAKNMIN